MYSQLQHNLPVIDMRRMPEKGSGYPLLRNKFNHRMKNCASLDLP